MDATNMVEQNYQKIVYSRWQGYSDDPGFKSVALRDKKLREYITTEGVGKTILDVGCADGATMAPLVKDHVVYGLELADHLAQKAQEKGLQVSVANIEEGFGFADSMFDIVVASEIIEHLANTDFFLSECNRVLKPGGKLILSVPVINNLFSPFILLLFDYPPTSSSRYRSPHVRDFTFSTLRVALENNGFLVEKRRGLVFYVPFMHGMLGMRGLLADWLPRFADEQIVKSKKVAGAIYDEQKIVEESGPGYMLKKI